MKKYVGSSLRHSSLFENTGKVTNWMRERGRLQKKAKSLPRSIIHKRDARYDIKLLNYSFFFLHDVEQKHSQLMSYGVWREMESALFPILFVEDGERKGGTGRDIGWMWVVRVSSSLWISSLVLIGVNFLWRREERRNFSDGPLFLGDYPNW